MDSSNYCITEQTKINQAFGVEKIRYHKQITFDKVIDMTILMFIKQYLVSFIIMMDILKGAQEVSASRNCPFITVISYVIDSKLSEKISVYKITGTYTNGLRKPTPYTIFNQTTRQTSNGAQKNMQLYQHSSLSLFAIVPRLHC